MRGILIVALLCAALRAGTGGEGRRPHRVPSAVAEVLRLARSKRWSEAAACLEALAPRALSRSGALCSVAVNTMARLHRPRAACHYLELLAPEGVAPQAALGALLKAYCLVHDLPRARELVLRIISSGPNKFRVIKQASISFEKISECSQNSSPNNLCGKTSADLWQNERSL